MSEDWRELAQRAVAALQENRVDEARRLGERLSELAAGEPVGAFVTGVALFKSRAFARAAELFSRALALRADDAKAHYWLGNALRHSGRLDAALRAYEEALRLAPHEDVRHNVTVTQRDLARVREGADLVARDRAEHAPQLAGRVLDLAAALARGGIEAPPAAPPEPAQSPAVSFVTCSITAAKLARLRASLESAMAGRTWELIAISDARSLSEGYTRGLARSSGELLVFCHDDIEILCADFYARLVDACRGADLVGVCGVTLLNGPALAWAGSPHLHSAVTHPGREADGSYWPGLCSTAGPRIDGAQALDGLFIAVWHDVARRIGFDAETFDAFDFYDLDFSYRAWKAGLRLRVQTDLHLLHQSRGNFGPNYLKYSERFKQKFAEFEAAPPFRQPLFHEVRAASLDEAMRVHGWVDHWLATAPVATPA